jgi:hypothetical protein
VLSRFDDYPIHQTTDPIRIPATTDRHTYDRYWFNGYSGDGEFYFGVGAALYPNLGIMDCGFSLVRDGVQYAFHASRRAPLEPSEIQVGPFRIDIIEPMKSLRVTLDDNETGLACQLDWIPRTASFAEGHQRTIRDSPIQMHATRFNQFGFWQGEIRYAGQSLQINPDRVYGTKDRSWGVRPVGDPAPPGAPGTRLPQVYFLWAPLHWTNRCTHAGLFENDYGKAWHWDGMVMPTYASPDDLPGIEDPDAQPVAALEHRVEFVPGTRRVSRAEFVLDHSDGSREEIELDPLLCFRMKGIGYGHRDWGHGRWKGELAMAGESWKCDEVDDNALENQHMQHVVRARSGSEEGVGVLEQIFMGPNSRRGLKGFLDPAQ